MLPLEFIIIAFFIGYYGLKSLSRYNANQRKKERLKNLFQDDRPKYYN